MKTVAKILAYTVAVVALGALIAPPLYELGQWAIATGLLPQLEGFRFSTYFNRAVLLAVVLTLWPFLRWLGLRRWTELGLSPNPRRLPDLALAVVVGACGLWLVSLGLVLTGHASLRDPVPWHKLGAILATAVVVPLIEETFFRGVLFGLLRRNLPWKAALGFLSFFFAVLHFIRPLPGAPRITDVRWYSGFENLARAFWQFGEPRLVIGGWLTLFLVGWILGYTVVKTRSLYMAMGLHGGWVFALRSFSQLSKRHGAASLWVGRDITTGLVPLMLLLGTLLLLSWLLDRRGVAGEQLVAAAASTESAAEQP